MKHLFFLVVLFFQIYADDGMSLAEQIHTEQMFCAIWEKKFSVPAEETEKNKKKAYADYIERKKICNFVDRVILYQDKDAIWHFKGIK